MKKKTVWSQISLMSLGKTYKLIIIICGDIFPKGGRGISKDIRNFRKYQKFLYSDKFKKHLIKTN